MYRVPRPARNPATLNASGPGSTAAARAGSAMNDSARDITIRTVDAVFCASDRSSARVIAHCSAPAARRMSSGSSGVAPSTHRATAAMSAPVRAAAWK